MNNAFKFLLPGLLLGWVIAQLLPGHSNPGNTPDATDKPLYWVAPMDPNFRRDQPGKSPMGMDLIPVYADAVNTGSQSAGEVSISPVVVNNLGLKTAVAQVGTLQGQINTIGIIQYDENKLLHVHPRVEGWIEKLSVKSTGDRVQQGQLLYEIYAPELVSAQEEFVLALKRNNAALIMAAEARLRALQIPEDIIKSLRKNQQVQQTIPHHSPQDGVIEQLTIREGFYVKPGTTLMSIADLSTVWVEAQVLNHNKPDLIVGATATMRSKAIPGRIWQGTVAYIYPALDPQTQTLRARLVFANDAHMLKPNMYVDVSINKPDLQALLIPKNALIRLQDENRVVIQSDETTYKSVAVVTGEFDDRMVQITSGLLPGDKVVTAAQFLLDSESSKTSDFDRMSLNDMANVAKVTGVVKDLDVTNRTATISRSGIAKWNRPPATVEFEVPERVDISQLVPGQSIQFYFQVEQGTFQILFAQPIIDGGAGS